MFCSSKGVYRKLRRVLSYDNFYLTAEYMECGNCHATFIASDEKVEDYSSVLFYKDGAYSYRMLDQVDDSFRDLFLAILTKKCEDCWEFEK